ncbi:MAG: IS4 family transposase, partial [candidate division WOR-3 bacterium]
GVVAKTFPLDQVQAILRETGRESIRQRQLPAHVVFYYVIALALFSQVSYGEVLRCLVEGLSWLGDSSLQRIRRTGRSAISMARARLGVEPLRRMVETAIMPIAGRETRGAWYRDWRLVSIDGTTLDLADTVANEQAFGRPGASRGKSAFPQLRMVSLVENGTHVLFGTEWGRYRTSENVLAVGVLSHLEAGMLCLADRGFFGYTAWKQAASTGADLLWRVKKNANLPCDRRLADGSYLSRIYASAKDRRHDRDGIVVRVIEYQMEGLKDGEPLYRLITTVLDDAKAPAKDLAALYHDRWEIENVFDEFKTHLRGRQAVLRSKTPQLVEQELYGFLLAHFAIRGLMHEAALKADLDPDHLSFIHTVRVVRRKLPTFAAIPPSALVHAP